MALPYRRTFPGVDSMIIPESHSQDKGPFGGPPCQTAKPPGLHSILGALFKICLVDHQGLEPRTDRL